MFILQWDRSYKVWHDIRQESANVGRKVAIRRKQRTTEQPAQYHYYNCFCLHLYSFISFNKIIAIKKIQISKIFTSDTNSLRTMQTQKRLPLTSPPVVNNIGNLDTRYMTFELNELIVNMHAFAQFFADH